MMKLLDKLPITLSSLREKIDVNRSMAKMKMSADITIE